MILKDAIAVYHDLLTDNLAADSQLRLDQQQAQHHLSFGERPMCTVLRPRFLTASQHRFLERRVGLLLAAFEKAHRLAMASVEFRKQFGLRDWEEELLQIYEGYDCAYPTSRLDAFFVSEDELFFTEYNSRRPRRAANDVLSEVFLGLPIMREFRRRYRVVPLPARPGVLDALLQSYLDWSGKRDLPTIAILDWKEVPTYTEFILFQEYFNRRGLKCVIADPREVEYSGGRLRVGETPIDLIYKRVLISELWERGGRDHPVLQALRDRAVCMVNGFACKLLYKKASFAVLTDENNAQLFSPGERQAIAAHIPWTRRVEERKTIHAGRSVDLLEHVAIIANGSYSSLTTNAAAKESCRGRSSGQWEHALRTATLGPTLCGSINVPSEPFPSLVTEPCKCSTECWTRTRTRVTASSWTDADAHLRCLAQRLPAALGPIRD